MSDPSLASPGVVAWRTRHLLGFLLVSGLVLLGLTLVASQTDPNVIDLGATRWVQHFQNPAFASLMRWVSWFGFAPQTWFLPLVLAAPFAVRRLWAESVWVLVALALPIVLVGPSRLYLGQHWLSDVLGGYAVASMLLLPCCWAYARWRLDVTRSCFTLSVRPANSPTLSQGRMLATFGRKGDR